MLPPYLAAPPNPLSARATQLIGGIETSLAACLRQDPSNAWMDAPKYARLVSLEPEASIPDCAAGSNWKAEGGRGAEQ